MNHVGARATEDALRLIESLAPMGPPVTVRDPLVEDECRWFLEGVNHGIVRFRGCPRDCFRARKWGVGGPDHFDTPSGKARHLFSRPAPEAAWLNREYVPHLAAYARAVVAFGYDRSRSSFSLYRKFSRDLIVKRAGHSYETDAEFYDADGRIHLQIEAKATPGATARLVNEIEWAGTLDQLPAGIIKEIEYVLDLRPRFLWVVGPGGVDPASYVYAVEASERNATFTPLEAFPAPPA